MTSVSIHVHSFMLTLLVMFGASALSSAQPAACGATPYECAVFHAGRQEFAAAVRFADEAVRHAPRDLKSINLLGIALAGAGRIDDANARFREALAIDPRFYPSRKNLAINEFNQGRLAEAQRHFEQVLKDAPEDEITHLHLAEIAYERGDTRAAVPHYEKSRAAVVRNPDWIVHHATALTAQQRSNEAVALFDRLPADDASRRFEAGVALGRAGAHAEAARFFGSARRGYKDPYAAAYNQVLMLIDATDYAAAIGVAEELLAQSTRPAELYNLVSQAYLKAGRLKEAYDALRTATHLEPAVDDHYIDLALICLDHENYDLGLEIVDVGLHYRPQSAALFLQRGVLLAMKGQVAQAEQAFDKARRIAPDSSIPYVALAMTWMQTGQVSRAVDVLRERVRINRSDGWMPYMFGIALLRSGIDPDGAAGVEALQAFESAARANAAFAPAHTELGKLLLKRGDVERGIAQLERAAALEPEDAGVLYVLGQAYRKKGDATRAKEMLERAATLRSRDSAADSDEGLKRVVVRIMKEAPAERTSSDPIAGYLDTLAVSPDRLEARYGLALACTNIGDLDGAIDLLRGVVKASPRHAEAHYNLGLTLWNRFKRSASPRRLSDLDEAMEALRVASQLDPSQAATHAALGQLLAEKQNLASAITSLRKARALAPEDPEHAYNLGLALRLNGDMEEAELRLREAVGRNPDHALARRALGLVLRQNGQLQGAATELRRSVAALPGDAEGHHLLGTVLLKLDAVAEAIEEFRRAVELDPALTEARVTLAQALARTGHAEDARREQAEIQRVNEAKASFARGLLLVETGTNALKGGDVATAVARLREAAHVSPDFADAHYQLGVALRRSDGDQATTEAQSAFRRVVELDPGHAGAHYQLGLLLVERGDTKGAVAELRAATSLAPSLVDAHRTLARIAAEMGDETTAAAARKAVLAWERLREK